MSIILQCILKEIKMEEIGREMGRREEKKIQLKVFRSN